jgi:hypothetical protein
MASGQVVENVAASVLGNSKKAFLVIHKDADMSSESVAELAERALRLSEGGNPAVADVFGGGKTHALQVQYNPSSISFNANVEPINFKSLQSRGGDVGLSQHGRPTSVTMSVQLVFDAMDAKDSFMADKFRLSASDAAQIAAARFGGKKYSVRPHTNALLAMLMRKESACVTFHWADMTFHGLVDKAKARYVMFSVSGEPVRSFVDVSINQIEQSFDNKYWTKAFDKCFGDEGASGDFGGQLKGQYVGNMLNLGF